MFSIDVVAPSGMNVGPTKRSQPYAVSDAKVSEGVRRGTVSAGAFLKTEMHAGMNRMGRHDSKRSRTKAPEGGPPQSVTGRLKGSISTTPARRLSMGIYETWIGPNANGRNPEVDVYSTTQQYGFLITARTEKGMRFLYGNKWRRGVLNVYVPPRPMTKTVETPVMQAQAADVFAKALKTALGDQWFGQW
jgi:hypothetical protein